MGHRSPKRWNQNCRNSLPKFQSKTDVCPKFWGKFRPNKLMFRVQKITNRQFCSLLDVEEESQCSSCWNGWHLSRPLVFCFATPVYPPFPLIGQQPPRCLPSCCNLETSIPASPPTFNPSILFTSNPSIPKFPCFGDRSALKFNFSISWEPDKQPLKSQDFRCLDSIKTLEKKRQKKTKETLKKKNCLMFISPLEKSVLKTQTTTKNTEKMHQARCIARINSWFHGSGSINLGGIRRIGSPQFSLVWKKRKKMDPTKKRLDGEQNQAQKLKTTWHNRRWRCWKYPYSKKVKVNSIRIRIGLW